MTFPARLTQKELQGRSGSRTIAQTVENIAAQAAQKYETQPEDATVTLTPRD